MSSGWARRSWPRLSRGSSRTTTALETLILCPKNLVPMWEDYREQYRLRARVLPITRVAQELPNLRRYRLVLIDESHNLRNREGKRYRAIHEYIEENESKVILLSATPYNKTYLDLSNQLRLFVPEDARLGLRPERLLRELGETEFIRRHQCSARLACRLREERVRGRLARADAPLPRPPHPHLHPGELRRDRCRDRAPISDVRGRHPLLFPGPGAADGAFHDRRGKP